MTLLGTARKNSYTALGFPTPLYQKWRGRADG